MKQVSLKRNYLLRRILVSILGTFVAAVGIQCIVASGLGADAVSTFILGIMNFLPLRFGTLSILFNAIILFVIYFSKRELIGLASLINSFGLGIFLNMLDALGVLTSTSGALSFVAVVAGTLLFGIGTGTYLLTNAGAGAYECLMVVIKQLLKLSTKTARILLDGSFMLIGFLLGGTVGVGTVLIVLLLGPTLDASMKILPKVFSFLRFDQ